ncbi:MAG: hypothetical protein ACYTG7_21045 [Planctomycetota bacterium]
MIQHRLYSGFWICVAVILSIVFVVLFFPIVQDRYGFPISVLLTALGVLVIWASYFIRAYIFSRDAAAAKNDHDMGG